MVAAAEVAVEVAVEAVADLEVVEAAVVEAAAVEAAVEEVQLQQLQEIMIAAPVVDGAAQTEVPKLTVQARPSQMKLGMEDLACLNTCLLWHL